jgi:uncharacterized membrane protein
VCCIVPVTPADLYLRWHRIAPDVRKMFLEAGALWRFCLMLLPFQKFLEQLIFLRVR